MPTSPRWIPAVLLAALVALGAAPQRAAAQTRPISLWVGAGRTVRSDSISTSLKNLDAYGALQLDVPLLPVALRGDVSFAGGDLRNGTRNASVSAIFPLRLPVIQPYAMAGYGIYDWGKSYETRGVSYGAGLRLQLGGIGIFGQARRHEKLDRTIGTVGLVF